MLNIIIFGTGSSAQKFVEMLDSTKVTILCFVDNDISKQYKKFKDRYINPPQKIQDFRYDYIVIASQYSNEIMEQLIDMGIKHNRIIPFDYGLHNKNNMEYYKKVHSLMLKDKQQHNHKLKIALINYNYSNYNGFALYKYMPDFIKGKYDVELVTSNDKEYLSKFDVICSSHYDGIYNGVHLNFEMWHGFPIKILGALQKTVTEKSIQYYRNRSQHTELVFSYSQLYTTFFNACFPSRADKYRITGMPRNDLLFEEGSLDKLESLCKRSLSGYNIVFYLPTWRKGKNQVIETSCEWTKLFGFKDEDTDRIKEILEKNKLFLVVKLHPFEFYQFKNLDIFQHEQVFLLSEDILMEYKIHLYELMGCCKVLITDYSSIFFDTLLIDTPLIFAPTDLDEYSENRGFLLEPYDYLTPGPTVFTLEELEKELKKYLNQEDEWKDKREQVKKLIFKYYDNKSSLRVWTEIDKYLSSYEMKWTN